MKKTKVKKISKRKQLKNIEKQLPKSYRPITGWGYFWLTVLYAIPVLGWLFLLFNAIGAKNRNVRNYARSYFCGLFLADALLEAKLVEGDMDTYGLYIKYVNGIRADYTLDGAYWSLSKGGEMLMTGASDTPIADGDSFELTYTKG